MNIKKIFNSAVDVFFPTVALICFGITIIGFEQGYSPEILAQSSFLAIMAMLMGTYTRQEDQHNYMQNKIQMLEDLVIADSKPTVYPTDQPEAYHTIAGGFDPKTCNEIKLI